MLVQIVSFTFGSVVLVFILLEALSSCFIKNDNTNPQFMAFQSIYFSVYFPLIFADWLNAPYLYKLYASYGFIEEQIAIIYVCGFASALVMGVGSTYIICKYKPKRVLIFAVLLYALSCFMKLSADYSVLIISRIVSGIGTSLIFNAQEIWYLDKHNTFFDFPPEWLQHTMSKAAKANGILATFAGLVSYLMSEWYDFGPVAPSILAACILVFSCLLLLNCWSDSALASKVTPLQMVKDEKVIGQATTEKQKFVKECLTGLRVLAQNVDLVQIGCIQALFESVLCMFVFLWTPVLDHHNPPLGIVFASFMAATLAGNSLYTIIKSMYENLSPTYSLLIILSAAAISVITCVISTEPTREFPVASFAAFFVFEVFVGGYFPTMTDLKHDNELDRLDVMLTTWFRIPLNLLACAGLLFLHSSSNTKGIRNLFVCCVLLIALAIVLACRFAQKCKNKKYSDEPETTL